MKTGTTISFGKNALETAYDATFSLIQGGQQPFGDFENLRYNLSNLNSYATFEPNFWLLDGSYKFVPATGANVGWMTTMQSPSGGVFPGIVPELRITFSTLHSTNGLTLYFSEHSGDWIERFTVGYYDASNNLIRADYHYPTGPIFSTNIAVNNFKRIDIFLYETNKSVRFARVTGIEFDTVLQFAGESVRQASVVEEIDLLSLSLPSNSFEAKLYSAAGAFDILDPAGLYSSFQFRNPLDVREHVGNEVIFIGRFYLDTWESLGSYDFILTAIDIIGVMDGMPHIGEWYIGAGYTLIDDILDLLLTPLGIPYELDPFWITYGVGGWLARGTVREALHQIVYALTSAASTTARMCAVVNCARSGKVIIQAKVLADSLPATDYTLSTAERGEGSSLSLKPLVTGVEVVGRLLQGTSALIDVYREPLTTGTYTLLFSEPFTPYSLTISGATFISTNINQAVISVASPGTVIIQGNILLVQTFIFSSYASGLPAGTVPNVVKIDDAQLIGYNLAANKAIHSLRYFQQRYLEKTKVLASKIRPGDSVLVVFTSGRQMKGIVERMTSQLTGGFVSDLEIVGVVI